MNNKDDDRLRKTTIAFLKEFADKGYENAVECIDWLEKQSEQKSTDKIEQKRNSEDSLLEFLKSTGIINENGELSDEYKSVDERSDVLEERKTIEWTEEDDVMLEKLLRHLNWNTSYGFNKKECDEAIDWLKSLKTKKTLSVC